MSGSENKIDISPRITYHKDRGQELMLVMHALADLSGENPKDAVILHIRNMGWFDWRKEDLKPYKNQSEPRFHTLLAWARKDGVVRDWILHNQRDAWALSRDGRTVFEKALKRFSEQSWDVRKCYLFTQKFKRLLDPQYKPSEQDATRPLSLGDEIAKLYSC